jgi:hypothetical protein
MRRRVTTLHGAALDRRADVPGPCDYVRTQSARAIATLVVKEDDARDDDGAGGGALAGVGAS